MKITFKRIPRAAGLAGAMQGPRGWRINVDGQWVGNVSPSQDGSRYNIEGWYMSFFSQHSKILCTTRINTCGELVATPEECKAAAKAHIKECWAEMGVK